jgi:hypothetical protein
MIQRKQTLFLFQSVFLGIALLFVPVYTVLIGTQQVNVSLVPVNTPGLTSTAGHLAAIALNFLALIFASGAVFMYKRRPLQVKLCYAIMVIWFILAGMTAFCPFVSGSDITVKNSFFGPVISLVGVLAAYLAAKYIKKDIELLKSADRIR